MPFCTSKCIDCTDRRKNTCKQIKMKDAQGIYYVSLYECTNYGCSVLSSVMQSQRKYAKHHSNNYETK